MCWRWFIDILRHFGTCRALLTRRTGDLNLGRFGELLPISTGDRISIWIGRFANRFAAGTTCDSATKDALQALKQDREPGIYGQPQIVRDLQGLDSVPWAMLF